MSDCSHAIAEENKFGAFICSECGKPVDARDALDVAATDRSMDAWLRTETCRKL